MIKLTSRIKSNQNIKLLIDIEYTKSINKLKFNSFSYNKEQLFFYHTRINNDLIHLRILIDIKFLTSHKKLFTGSFIFDISNKFNVDLISINCKDKNRLELTVLEFLQKDFIFNKYLAKLEVSKYKTSYKLSYKNKNLLSSLILLKELVSQPSNIIYPDTFAKILKKEINTKKIKLNIFNKTKIKKIGLNCLLSVNQGSMREPRVVTFESKKKNSRSKVVDVLFVGKGVCFDSGGISIKPSSGMEDMKWDMAGAAVVSSIIKYLGTSNHNFSYAGIIGLVENMPSGSAYKPGDIIKSYKGINVEVLNTDAEGRLVLADIISYGCDIYKPKLVIDFATLTGAIMVALGQHYAGMYSNDKNLADSLYDSGLRTNEKVWRMPLHEDFDKELDSPFVDLKNITNSRYGGSVTAAQFLQRFIPENTKWAHLDIAGVTWKNNGDIMNNKGATGFGLTLISDFIENYF